MSVRSSRSSNSSANSESSFARQQDDDTTSMGSTNSALLGDVRYQSRRFLIELNIRLLYVSDKKYFNEAFKIYWMHGKKKIDTRVAVVRSDTQTAKFADKFQMRTVLNYDEENDEYKGKPSVLQLYLLQKALPTPEDGENVKLQLTGKEFEMGQVMVDLAKYAKDRDSSEKLYIDDNKDMYIEIAVHSKPMEEQAQA